MPETAYVRMVVVVRKTFTAPPPPLLPTSTANRNKILSDILYSHHCTAYRSLLPLFFIVECSVILVYRDHEKIPARTSCTWCMILILYVATRYLVCDTHRAYPQGYYTRYVRSYVPLFNGSSMMRIIYRWYAGGGQCNNTGKTAINTTTLYRTVYESRQCCSAVIWYQVPGSYFTERAKLSLGKQLFGTFSLTHLLRTESLLVVVVVVICLPRPAWRATKRLNDVPTNIVPGTYYGGPY